MATPKEILEIGGREVSISQPDKVYFPKTGYTKLDLVRYYLAVADGALTGSAAGRWRSSASSTARQRSRSSRSARRTTGPTGSGRRADVPVRADGRRDRRRRRGRPRLDRQPRLHRPQPAPGPRRRPRPSRRAARRPRPGPGRALVADPRRGARRRTRRSRRSGWSAGRRRPARAGSTSTSASSGAGRIRRSAGPPSRSPGTSSGGRRRSPPRSGGRRSATASSSTTTRTPRTGRSPRPTPCGRCRMRASRRRCAGTRCRRRGRGLHARDGAEASTPSAATPAPGSTTRWARSTRCSSSASGTKPKAWATRRGRPTTRSRRASRRASSRHASARPTPSTRGRGEDGGPPPEVAAERAAAVAAGDPNAGLPTEWVGTRPTPTGRRKSNIPVIEIARAATKAEVIEGLERWKARHPEVAAAPRAGRHPGRRDARPRLRLVPAPGEPDPRPRGAATCRRNRSIPTTTRGRATNGPTRPASWSGRRRRSRKRRVAAPEPRYPFVPKSNAYLRAGQFWAVPLSDRPLRVRPRARRPADAGTPMSLRTRGCSSPACSTGSVRRPPTTESIAGADLIAQGFAHIKAILTTGGAILGWRDLATDAIVPDRWRSHVAGGTVWLYEGAHRLRPATNDDRDLPVMGTWGIRSFGCWPNSGSSATPTVSDRAPGGLAIYAPCAYSARSRTVNRVG